MCRNQMWTCKFFVMCWIIVKNIMKHFETNRIVCIKINVKSLMNRSVNWGESYRMVSAEGIVNRWCIVSPAVYRVLNCSQLLGDSYLSTLVIVLQATKNFLIPAERCLVTSNESGDKCPSHHDQNISGPSGSQLKWAPMDLSESRQERKKEISSAPEKGWP